MVNLDDAYMISFPMCPLCNKSNTYSVATVIEVNQTEVTVRMMTMHNCAEDTVTWPIRKRSEMYEAMNALPPMTTRQ